jgi:transposase
VELLCLDSPRCETPEIDPPPAGRTSHYRPIVERMRDRHGRRRGTAIASVEIARKLSEAIWWMLTRNQPFAPAGAL